MEGRTKINLGGVDYPLMFGYLSFTTIFSETNRGVIFQEDGRLTDIGVPMIIYAGYENHCHERRSATKISLDDFSREVGKLLIQDGGLQTVQDIIKVWQDSRDVQDLVSQNKEKKSDPVTPTESTSPPSNESPTVS